MGVGRFAARRCTQALPYCRADVELLVDPEEQAAFEPLALQALDSAAGSQAELPLPALMAAVPAAARAAAAAYQQVRAGARPCMRPQPGSRPPCAGVPCLQMCCRGLLAV